MENLCTSRATRSGAWAWVLLFESSWGRDGPDPLPRRSGLVSCDCRLTVKELISMKVSPWMVIVSIEQSAKPAVVVTSLCTRSNTQ